MNLTMHQAAEMAGLSYDRFRKVWPQLCAADEMPAPVRGCVWDAEAMAAWRTARSQRQVTPAGMKRLPAPPLRLTDDRARRGRAQLNDLRRAG